MNKKTIGLCMIVKDEIADVIRIIKHYGKCFDKIYITVTHESELSKFKELPTLMEEYNSYISISYFEWIKDFSAARNFSFSQADTDYIFWMDADDALANPEGLHTLIENYPEVDVFYMNYLYAFDESGNCMMQHNRERLVRNTNILTWKGRVHETLIPVEDVLLRKGDTRDVSVVHQAKMTDIVESHKRNVEILIAEWNEFKEKTDPRTISYLAGELTALKQFDRAIKFYEKHIELSGWQEDKYLSWNKIAQNLVSMYLENNDSALLNTAISALSEAVLMMPEIPDAYLTMGEVYWHLKDWKKAIEWTNTGLTKNPDVTLPYHDPTRYSIRPLPILAYSYLNEDEVERAYAYMSEAYKRAPKNPFIKDNFPFFEKIYNETKVFKNIINIASYLEQYDREKLKLLPDIIPNDLAGDDRFILLRHKYMPAKIWSDKSVVIYCPQTVEEWAPPSTKKGIGGSEEAVIYLSRELKNLGYEVTVFNACGELEGTYDGVEYKNYWHFNKRDVFNVVISWRHNIFPAEITANRKIVWLHDVPFKNNWSKEEYDSVDKIIVLSEYHKTLFPDAPEGKIYVSTNGINVEDMISIDAKNISRNKHRIIYGSSYNRGLEHILDMWPEIIKECPLAELHIFYGWNTFDAMNSGNEDMQKWKARIIEKMKQPGIVEHGRVGHKKLLEEYARSSIWAYPTFFPEINCITGIKAQAMGCFPVYHNQFALKDTVHYGYKVEPKEHEAMLSEFKDKLINALKDPQTIEEQSKMQEDIRSKYSWTAIATDWSEKLF